jgi:AAA family ATP:ADP antiporter
VDSPRITLARLVDVRPGEWALAMLSFGVLLLTSGAYTVLETARDALLVTNLPRHDFGLPYIAVAAFSLPTAGLLTRLGQYLGPRRVLLLALAASALAGLGWYAFPVTRTSVVAFYVVVGLISSSVFPQFWLLMGGLLTVGQSRRLFGPIGAAAVFGSALGAAIAAVVVPSFPVRSLPLIAATIFMAAVGVAFSIPQPPPKPRGSEPRPVKFATSLSALKAEPFLLRVAILVVLTTATALAVDYFFKWTISRSIPDGSRAMFVARYYALINGAAVVVQLFLGTALVRRLGVATALEVTPIISLFGAGAALVGGAAILPVLFLKGADASLRSSINRLTTELVYLPVSAQGRERAKPFVDGALMRLAQAATAGMLYGLSNLHLLSPHVFSTIVVLFALAWLGATLAIRKPYLSQLRQSVTPSEGRDATSALPLDLAGAELLVEHLGSDEPQMVIASMNTLARRGHHRLIPALILRHPDERVLARALAIFGATARGDWPRLAGELLAHASEHIRIGAARALALQGKLDARKLAEDSDPSVRGYATLLAALGEGEGDLAADPRIARILRDGESDYGRLGLLAAIADAPPSGRFSSLLVALAAFKGVDGATWTELLARAAVRHHEVALIPQLVARLAQRAGRAPIRDALVALGEPALEAVAKAFEDPGVDRKVRVHIPLTLARFGTKWAADKLLEGLETGTDGQVRYKALRALGRLVAAGNVRVDRIRIERIAQTNFAAYFQLLGLRVALGAPPTPSHDEAGKTYALFAGLVDDKLRQSVERAFRLLKIAHPKEDIHRVYLACLSSDRRARSNASEFLDALLRRRDQEPLREIVRVFSDDLPAPEQVVRASRLLGYAPPANREEAIRAAMNDPDIKLASLAALYAVAMGDEGIEAAIQRRPALASAAGGRFQEALLQLRGSHA